MSGGTITRKDLITDEGLEFGKEYAKNIRLAIEANDDLVDSAKALAQIANSYQKANNSQAFITAKNEEKLALQRVENAIKAEEVALKSAEKIKQETLRTKKLELDAINKEEAAKRRTTKLTVEERVQNEINNRVLKQAALEKLGLVSAYDKLNRSRTEAKNKLRDLIATENASTEAIKKAQAEFDKLDAKVKRADDAVRDFTKNVGNYPNLKSFTSGVKDLAGAFGIAAGSAAFVSVLKGAITIVKEFDQSVADLRAITGAGGADLEYLKKQAIEMGKGVKGGAVAVVESYKLIASAKPELLENVQDLNKVTQAVITLAKASGMELPEAATALTDAMNQFGADASLASEYVDTLANGAKYGAAEIPELTESLLKFGAVAKSSNVSIGESTALIELLAEKGLKGAEAGTALRNVLLKLSAPEALPKEAQKAFDILGISIDTLKDKTIPIQQRFEALKPLLEDDAALVRVFGQENIVAAKNVIGHTDRLAELTSKMNEYGTAQKQASIRSKTLQGKTERLTSQYDSFILSLNEGSGVVSGFFSLFIDGASNGLFWLQRMNTSWDELYKKAKEEGIEMGQNAIKVEGKSLDDLITMRKRFFEEGQKIREEIKKAEQDLANFNPYALNFFGPSGKDLKKNIEALNNQLGQIEGAWDKTRTKINDINKEKDVELQKEEEEAAKISAEEQKKRQEETERRRKEHLAKMKKLDDDAFALAKFRMEQEIEISKEIQNDESETIEDRINAYLNSQQVETSLIEETTAQKLRAISQYNDDVRDLTNNEIQTLIDGGQIKKNLTDDEILVLEEYQSKKEKLDKKDLENRKKIIDSIISIEQKKTDKVLQNQDTELNKRLIEENKWYEEEIALLEGNQEAILDATIEHEARILKIKEDSARKALQTQIDVQKELLKNSELSADKKAEIENKLSKLELDLNQIGVNSKKESNDKKADLEEAYSEKIKELQKELQNVLIDFTNSLLNSKIANIDAELQANEDYYARQIELAGNDEAQKSLLEQEREKKREALEKKKKKAEFQAALFNKIITLATIASQTAMASVAALAPPPIGLGPVLGPSLLPYIITTGAIQAAIVAATPLPKYEKGTQGKPHKGGKALVGEVRPEVILEPGKNPYVVEKPSILNLPKGTEVIPSINEWERMQRASIMASLDMEANKAKNYKGADAFNARYDAELLEELRRNTEATKKNKSNLVVQNNIDFGHEIWKLSNIKWGS